MGNNAPQKTGGRATAEATFIVNCPQCSCGFSVTEGLRGLLAECSDCGATFQIPKTGNKGVPAAEVQAAGQKDDGAPTIEVVCPKCKTVFHTHEAMRGFTAECSVCGHSFTVPKGPKAAEKTKTVAAPEPEARENEDSRTAEVSGMDDAPKVNVSGIFLSQSNSSIMGTTLMLSRADLDINTMRPETDLEVRKNKFEKGVFVKTNKPIFGPEPVPKSSREAFQEWRAGMAAPGGEKKPAKPAENSKLRVKEARKKQAAEQPAAAPAQRPATPTPRPAPTELPEAEPEAAAAEQQPMSSSRPRMAAIEDAVVEPIGSMEPLPAWLQKLTAEAPDKPVAWNLPPAGGNRGPLILFFLTVCLIPLAPACEGLLPSPLNYVIFGVLGLIFLITAAFMLAKNSDRQRIFMLTSRRAMVIRGEDLRTIAVITTPGKP